MKRETRGEREGQQRKPRGKEVNLKLVRNLPYLGQIVDPYLMIYTIYDLYDLSVLAHVAGWEPYTLDVLYRSCTAYHNGSLASR